MKKIIWWVVGIIIILALALGGWWKFKKGTNWPLPGVKANQYQSVFLTNGQVYFGHLTRGAKDDYKLSDIYYLQVNQALQSTKEKEQTTQQPDISLIKLGSELHGPEDEMFFNREQVIFWENMKDDAKVVQAIKEYKTKGPQTQQTTAPQTQTAPAQTATPSPAATK